MSEAQENSVRSMPTPGLSVDEVKRQLESANQQLETAQLSVNDLETNLAAQREQLAKEVSRRQTLESQLEERKTQYEDARGKLTTAEDNLKEKANELETLRARRFKPNDLAKMGIGLFILLVIGAGILSYFILKGNTTWWQTSAVLGLYLFCSAFAAISMRLLADRCK